MQQQSASPFRSLILPTMVAALGGLLFGYDLSVISGANDALKVHFDLSEAEVGIVGSSAILGCIPGALLAGFLGDKLGRKKSLLITAILYIVSALWSAYPQNFEAFLAARFINGLAVGAASMICPTYISELAPKKHRGWLGTLFQLGIVTGIFVVFFCIREIHAYGADLDQVAGAAKDTWHHEKGWRWMLASEAIPAAPFLFLLLLVPESPRWLLQVGKAEKAKAVLAKILGHDEADAEIHDIQTTSAQGEAPFSHLFSKALRRPLVIACGLAIFCQICGINAIMYYAPKVFEGAEGTDSALKNAIWVGGVNFLATFIAIFCIDLVGRRPLLLIGSALQVVMLAITAWKVNNGETGSALLWPILGFIAAFAMAMGPLPWVVISEIFPGNIRGRAVSVGVGSVWVACYLVALSFPVLLSGFGPSIHNIAFTDLAKTIPASHPDDFNIFLKLFSNLANTFPVLEHGIGLGGTFLLYAIFSLASFFFVLFLLPETKGRTLEEISASWTKKA